MIILERENKKNRVIVNKSMQLIGKVLRYILVSKREYELSYWKICFREESGRFGNSHYKKLMLAIANEKDDTFLAGKTVADFGCGPRGSLVWAKSAARRIGIDVLVDRYMELFGSELKTHQMEYIRCSEKDIPLASESVDVLFSVNSLDHVADLIAMCSEMNRILKPGGLLIGSFNLNHKPGKAEPQKLTEAFLRSQLFPDFDILSWRISAPGNSMNGENLYQPFYDDRLKFPGEKEAILWAKAQKRLS